LFTAGQAGQKPYKKKGGQKQRSLDHSSEQHISVNKHSTT